MQCGGRVELLLVLLCIVEWLIIRLKKRIILVRGADLSEKMSWIFVGNMCVFVSRPIEIVTLRKKRLRFQIGLLSFFG